MIATEVISVADDEWVRFDDPGYTCSDAIALVVGKLITKYTLSWVRFPLVDLPAPGLVVHSVELRFKQFSAQDNSWLAVVPYNGDGQTDPSADTCEEKYNRAFQSGAIYSVSGPYMNADGGTIFDLRLRGGVEAAIVAAKHTVGFFALGLHTPDPSPTGALLIEMLDAAGTDEMKLLIRYSQQHIPDPTGAHRSRGLVTDQQGAVKAHIL